MVKINKFPSNHIILFFIFFQGIILPKIYSYISFTNPYGISLSNEKIFVIHKFGISLYDKYLTTMYKNLAIFTGDEELTNENILKIASAYKYEYILVIIKNIIHIINNTWEIIFKEVIQIKNENYNIYFSIIPINFNQNFYRFLISYVDNGKIQFLYYQYNIQNNTLTLIYDYQYNIKNFNYINSDTNSNIDKDSPEFKTDNNIIESNLNIINTIKTTLINKGNMNNGGNSGEDLSPDVQGDRPAVQGHEAMRRILVENYYIENNGLSCQYMLQNDKNLLICFYLAKNETNKLMLDYYDIADNAIEKKLTVELYNFNSIEPKYIKSAINSDRNKALICAYSSGSEFEFFGFDINSLDLTSNSTKLDLNNIDFTYPIESFNGIKINYLNETNDFVFSFNDESSIKIFLFSEGFNVYKKDTLNFYCSNINDYVIFYSNNNSEYYVLPFAQNCDVDHIPFESLYQNEVNSNGIITEWNSEEQTEEIAEKSIGETMQEKIIETNILTYQNENGNNIECKEMDKCNKCGNQSASKNLCLECNRKKKYYFLNVNKLPKSKISELSGQYIDCVNSTTKPKNYYFNKENQDYEPCFSSCATCEYGGDQIENNCTLCGINYRNQPDKINSTNCVIKCNYFYYYTYYGEFKCTETQKCPKEYSIFIPEKKKCIDECTNDDIYRYQYNGECLNKCPNNTNNESFICKDINKDINKCIIVEKNLLPIDKDIIGYESENLARNYAKEFAYTNNHVSIYSNNIYSIIIYKNDECLKQLSIEIIKIDFNECKEKIRNTFNIDNNLIIVIITKVINNLDYKKIISYSIFSPNTTEKLITKNVCENEKFLIEENLRIKLEKANYDIDSLLFFAKQDINIFNLSDPFYNDICFPFESLLEKDIALKDRILLYYPNITLCENGCELIGINTTSLRSECSCKSNFINNIFNDNNILLKSQELQEIKEIISNTNIEIIRCYKNIFLLRNIISCIGGFIIAILILGQIISSSIFFCKNIYLIRKYIFSITNKYINFLKIENIKNEPIISYNNKPFDINNKQSNKRATKKFEGNIVKKNKKKGQKRKSKSKIQFSIKEDNKSRNLILLNKSKNNSGIEMKNINNNNTSGKNIKIVNHHKLSIYDSSFINSKDILINSNNQKYNPNILSESKEVQEYLSTEIEDMDYEDAIKRDKRKFCEYFCDKLKINQILLSTFYAIDPLKPRAIKLLLFILDIELYLFINALFFNEEYISEFFHSTKEESFLYFIIRSYNRFFYATLVGAIINYILECFFVDEKKIKGVFKREKDNMIFLKYEVISIIKKIIFRNTFFIIFSFLMSIFSLYYILCFNSVYPHMRNEWIKSSIIIIIVMQFLYLLECLFETTFRFISFRFKNERFYKISLLLS